MFEVTKYPHGTFSWADCSSSDPDKSKQFYSAVMGWAIDDLPLGEGMAYTMLKCNDLNVAGLGPMMPGQDAMPSYWTNYVNVDDADAVVSKAKDLGATIIAEPMDIFDSGRMAIIQDPNGAMLGLWQANNHIGASLVNTPGAMCWNELMTPDPQQAQDFYGKLFGWTFTPDENSGYIEIQNNGRSNGGILKMDDNYQMPPNWQPYFSVADLDATIDKVKANGGQIHVDKNEIPDVGHFAVIGDPTGAVCTIIQMIQPQPWDV